MQRKRCEGVKAVPPGVEPGGTVGSFAGYSVLLLLKLNRSNRSLMAGLLTGT